MNWSDLGTALMVMVFLLACVLLILTVLIQKPQGGGLAGAFGSGAGSGQTAFGTRTGDALTVATIIMFVFYLGSAIGLTFLIKPSSGSTAASASAPAGGTKPADTTSKPAEVPAGAAPATPATTPTTTPASTPAVTTTPATTPATAPPAAPEKPEAPKP